MLARTAQQILTAVKLPVPKVVERTAAAPLPEYRRTTRPNEFFRGQKP
jgi:hypothetical protein